MINKLFSLLVGILLASNMNCWAQGTIDEAPFVSPYTVNRDHGAKPIDRIEHVNAVETRYFQFIVGEENDFKGKRALTMVWKKATSENPAHYELALEDLTSGTGHLSGEPRVRLERTLWEVRAKRDEYSQTLYYTFINKASQLPLQLSTEGNSIEIVNGSTAWLWSDGDKATKDSQVDRPNVKVLQGRICAAVNSAEMIYLVDSEGTGLKAFKQNSNKKVPNDAIIFEAWEANPILLTAEQINAELGYKDVTTQNQGKKNSFKFTFDPDVEGLNVQNVMTSYSFRAEPAKEEADRTAGDALDGFVRFQAWEGDKLSGKYLMVDTVYHDSEINNCYDLQMAVKTIEYPKHAVIYSGEENNTPYTVKDGVLYEGEKEIELTEKNAANVTLAQLKRQTNFRPTFFPSTQSLYLQAEMIFKANKEDLKDGKPWWHQMYEQVNNNNSKMNIQNISAHTYWNNVAGYFKPFVKTRAGDFSLLSWGNSYEWNKAATSNGKGATYADWYEAANPDYGDRLPNGLCNMVKMITLSTSPKHVVLTCDIPDPSDKANPDGHGGLLTKISLEGLFLPLAYTVSYNTPDNGTLSITYLNLGTSQIKVNNNDLVCYGTKLFITATAESGYVLDRLRVNAVEFPNGTTFMVNDNVTINATFKKEPTPSPVPVPTYYTVTLPAVEGVQTNPAAGDYKIEAWDSFRFYLELDKAYDQSFPVITTNRGETLTPRISDGAYIAKYVRSDLQIYIDGIIKNIDPVANENIEIKRPKVWNANNLLYMQSPTNEQAYIYTTNGKLQVRCKLIAGKTETVQLPSGIYFVQIGKEQFKVGL